MESQPAPERHWAVLWRPADLVPPLTSFFCILLPFPQCWNLLTSQMTFAGTTFSCLKPDCVCKARAWHTHALEHMRGAAGSTLLHYLIIGPQFLGEGTRESTHGCGTVPPPTKPGTDKRLTDIVRRRRVAQITLGCLHAVYEKESIIKSSPLILECLRAQLSVNTTAS